MQRRVPGHRCFDEIATNCRNQKQLRRQYTVWHRIELKSSSKAVPRIEIRYRPGGLSSWESWTKKSFLVNGMHQAHRSAHGMSTPTANVPLAPRRGMPNRKSPNWTFIPVLQSPVTRIAGKRENLRNACTAGDDLAAWSTISLASSTGFGIFINPD